MACCRLCGGDPDAAVIESWAFSLALDPPSQNEVAKNGGRRVGGRKVARVVDGRIVGTAKVGGRFVTDASSKRYRAVRDGAAMLVARAMTENGIPRATAPRRLIITRRYTGRGQARDKGNLIGGLKPVLDGMISAGLIVDDSPKWLEDHYHQHRDPDGPAMITVIVEVLTTEAPPTTTRRHRRSKP